VNPWFGTGLESLIRRAMIESNIYAFLVIAMIIFTPLFIYRNAYRAKFLTLVINFLFAILVFFLVLTIVALLGLHWCDNGAPSGLIGSSCAFLSILFLKDWKLSIKTMFGFTFYNFLIGLYFTYIVHFDSKVIGNIDMASGTFWHSALTGLYPMNDESISKYYDLKFVR